jgi:hypothetical protein
MILRRSRERRLFRRLASAEVPEGERAIAAAHAAMLANARRQRVELEAALPDLPPRCPRCGGTLVIRLARRGRNVGNEFWGCSSWPDCHYAASLETHPQAEPVFESYARG